MPSVVHVVVTGNFAGVERYVCNTANELAARNWDVSVVGGSPKRMPSVLGTDVRWLPGETPREALHSLARLGRQDLCHAHMTNAELIATVTRPLHRAPIVSTRHFAARRGSTAVEHALAPLISANLAREIAVSDFVARSVERRPDAVIINGIPPSPCLWQPSSRVVLVMQRLEKEKDTFTALRAWHASRLQEQGWSMRIVGNGAQLQLLHDWVSAHRIADVVFTGWTDDVADELARAGLLLAPAPAEPLGLVVLEAMAAGVPVVACAGGGHLETVGRLPRAPLFPAENSDAAATVLQTLLQEQERSSASTAGRHLVATNFTVRRHVDLLLAEYETARMRRNAPNEKRGVRWRVRTDASADEPDTAALQEIVVCSLETWDEVWRRNQFFVDILLRRNSRLRVLFVEPPTDPAFELTQGRMPTLPGLRTATDDGRLRVLRPLKLLPRRAGPLADALLRRQVQLAARVIGFSSPTLWINDATYAPLITTTRWPSLYDVTDDWLLQQAGGRELARLRELDRFALEHADEVVVCSCGLRRSRGATRRVSLVQNGVNLEHFRRPRPRPADLPDAPTAVYVGTLHESRLDIDLICDLAHQLPHANVVLIGPNSLQSQSQRLLAAEHNVHLLGTRPYADVPAYLQHADVIIVPHRVTPFTESLDPDRKSVV